MGEKKLEPLTSDELRTLVELEKNATPPPWKPAPDGAPYLLDGFGVEVLDRGSAELVAWLRNAAPLLFPELLALREENERLKRERADGGTKAMPPRSPPPPPPRPVRAVAGTSLVCTACGCRWKKHPPDDVFPQGSLQLYDADQRPCVECCDNRTNPPLRHETPDDAKGDPA